MGVMPPLSFSICRITALLLLLLSTFPCRGFEFHEATIDGIQLAFREGSLTSRRLVEFYLTRIRALNPLLHAVIEVNPDALRQAELADRERQSGRRPCGGLHGIPVLLKDNIATRDRLNTTAGSFALLGSKVPRDAGVVRRLRRAGAVILGKANMAEWANFRSLDAPSSWSARGGQGRVSCSIRSPIPHELHLLGARSRIRRWNAEPVRAVGGSVRFKHRIGDSGGGQHGNGDAGDGDGWVHHLSLGLQLGGGDQTHRRPHQPGRRRSHLPETGHGRVRQQSPSYLSARVAPLVFLVLIKNPLQETSLLCLVGSPIGRTVSDAVQVLEAIVGFDQRDAVATKAASKYIPRGGYKQFLQVDGLRGKRIGILRAFFTFPNGSVQQKVFEEHFNTMR